MCLLLLQPVGIIRRRPSLALLLQLLDCTREFLSSLVAAVQLFAHSLAVVLLGELLQVVYVSAKIVALTLSLVHAAQSQSGFERSYRWFSNGVVLFILRYFN